MTLHELRAAYTAARTLDPDRLARLAERQDRARSRLERILGERQSATVPGYTVRRADGQLVITPCPASLPDGWAQLTWTDEEHR